MPEVWFTTSEAAEVLQRKRSVVLREIAGTYRDRRKRFPNAKLAYGSRKAGYRIPGSDLLAYAQEEGDWLIERVQREIDRRFLSGQADLAAAS